MLHRLKTDFRLSIITLLGASAILGITPFAAMRFMQGNTLAGSVDTAILVGILITLIYAWASGDTRRSGLVLAVIACSGAVTVGAVVGEPGLFWLYPCLVTTFFLANPRIAVFLNVASVVVLMIHGGAFRSDVQMWSFASTAFVVSACAYVFAHRNHDQRERLEHLATIDPLTGIKNRRSMDQELDLGLRSVAVPVFSGSGELLGALNISTNAARVDMDTLLNTYLPRLQLVADKVRQTAR